MIACFDVHYEDDVAIAAAVLIANWTDVAPINEFVVRCEGIESYRAGSFFERELKPLQELVRSIPISIGTFVVDAYCHLSEDRDRGLGAYLYELLPEGSVVIGVAKNRFRDTTHAEEVLRGESQRPLFVTSIGIDYSLAAEHIKSMAGVHRNPTILKAVDRLCRKPY